MLSWLQNCVWRYIGVNPGTITGLHNEINSLKSDLFHSGTRINLLESDFYNSRTRIADLEAEAVDMREFLYKNFVIKKESHGKEETSEDK